jgi:hypothetical protein
LSSFEVLEKKMMIESEEANQIIIIHSSACTTTCVPLEMHNIIFYERIAPLSWQVQIKASRREARKTKASSSSQLDGRRYERG